MTWEQADKICFDQMPLIARPLPPDYWGTNCDWRYRVRLLFQHEQHHKGTVDAAMRQFSRERTWPLLPAGAVNFLAGSRLMCASDTAKLLQVRSGGKKVIQEPRGKADCELLEWLLIETWNEWRWDAFLKLQALCSLTGGDLFYGEPPMPASGN